MSKVTFKDCFQLIRKTCDEIGGHDKVQSALREFGAPDLVRLDKGNYQQFYQLLGGG